MSLISAIAGYKRAIVWSDSREVFDDGEHSSDSSRRLFQCGDRTVCGITGLLNLGLCPYAFIPDRIETLYASDQTLRDNPRAFLSSVISVSPRFRARCTGITTA